MHFVPTIHSFCSQKKSSRKSSIFLFFFTKEKAHSWKFLNRYNISKIRSSNNTTETLSICIGFLLKETLVEKVLYNYISKIVGISCAIVISLCVLFSLKKIVITIVVAIKSCQY